MEGQLKIHENEKWSQRLPRSLGASAEQGLPDVEVSSAGVFIPSLFLPGLLGQRESRSSWDLVLGVRRAKAVLCTCKESDASILKLGRFTSKSKFLSSFEQPEF